MVSKILQDLITVAKKLSVSSALDQSCRQRDSLQRVRGHSWNVPADEVSKIGAKKRENTALPACVAFFVSPARVLGNLLLT